MTSYQYDDAMQVLNTTIEKALFEVQVDPDLTPSMKEDLANIYRDLFLRVISELWVEYLTEMEALRVAIGLEAYAQRDPLVQYKNRGFEMFQRLMDEMRKGVVNRMFTFQPRNLERILADVGDQAPVPKAV